MSDNEMLYCLIAFILGWLASRMMGGEGFAIGAPGGCFDCGGNKEFYNYGDCVPKKPEVPKTGESWVDCRGKSGRGGEVWCNAYKIQGPCRQEDAGWDDPNTSN